MNNKKVVVDRKKLIKYLKILGVVLVVVLFLWFLIIHPLLTFRGYENQIEEAAKRYYELNANQLPTGKRVKTLSVQELFDQSYLKEDFYVPFSKKPCSITESWVKVRQEDGEYKYYTYLKCGAISSIVDHDGPKITLNGDDEITIDKGDKYKELGVKSVVDNSDGKLDVNDVVIDSSDVNTNVTGTYEVTYTIKDSLNNQTKKVRKVKVVSRLENIVKQSTNNSGVYTGGNPHNYIYFSGMLFRIVDIDGDNVRIVADEDVSNVNYSAIDEWLEYYYDHITSKSKKYVVKNKYCNMKATDNNISNLDKCSSYTKEVNVSILSASDINQATDKNGDNYLFPDGISWVRNEKDQKTAYATRNVFYGYGTQYMAFSQNYNLGIRPVLTIKGDALVVSGDGTLSNPYSIDDFTYAKTNDKLNSRYSGEYILYSGMLWRIVDVSDDGTTKVIANTTIYNDGDRVETFYDTDNKAKVYNPEQKGNVGYFINNQVTQYVNTEYFVNKQIEVPIYKNNIKYGEESSTKKYKVKLSAPNMYEMFSAFDFGSETMKSYWLLNSSRAQYKKAVISDIGVVMYGDLYDYGEYGIRPVGYFDKSCVVVRGNGTLDNPYIITK
ncbi:MAG TPA: DUF5011 domain-containing protein [Candidatus Faecimonas gallistercoris]|nr:DUF5011 domain-containing protein [Candidatus Faecimonas gallistercoris]